MQDFGEAQQLRRKLSGSLSSGRGTIAGSPVYMAPEMRDADEAVSPKADVFSAGVVVMEVGSGLRPNPGAEMKSRQAVPEEKRREDDLAAVRRPEVQELARYCIVDKAANRADATEVLRMIDGNQHYLPVAEGQQHDDMHSTLRVLLPTTASLSVPVQPDMTIAQLFEAAEAAANLPASDNRVLMCGCRELDPVRTVDDYSLLQESVVHMVERLPGGAPPDIWRPVIQAAVAAAVPAAGVGIGAGVALATPGPVQAAWTAAMASAPGGSAGAAAGAVAGGAVAAGVVTVGAAAAGVYTAWRLFGDVEANERHIKRDCFHVKCGRPPHHAAGPLGWQAVLTAVGLSTDQEGVKLVKNSGLTRTVYEYAIIFTSARSGVFAFTDNAGGEHKATANFNRQHWILCNINQVEHEEPAIVKIVYVPI